MSRMGTPKMRLGPLLHWSGIMHTKIPRARKTGAFTLVEILVVVIILGIAGAIIVPSLGSRDDLKAAAAARVIMADLIYTQNLAITSQGNRYMAFNVPLQNYSVPDADSRVIPIT